MEGNISKLKPIIILVLFLIFIYFIYSIAFSSQIDQNNVSVIFQTTPGNDEGIEDIYIGNNNESLNFTVKNQNSSVCITTIFFDIPHSINITHIFAPQNWSCQNNTMNSIVNNISCSNQSSSFNKWSYFTNSNTT